MSAAPRLAPEGRAAEAAHPLATPARVPAPTFARGLAARLGNEWLPRAAWTLSRTGRPGLAGIALLLATGVFLASTHLPVAAEVEALRRDLAAAQGQERSAAVDRRAGPSSAPTPLPARAEMPALLRQLFGKATHAGLAVDTGKYEVDATGSAGVVRYRISFPVAGPYPQIRSFIDATLSAMPAVALNDLAFDRKTIGDGSVEAQIRMTVYAAAAGGPGAGPAAAVQTRQDRVVAPTHAAALFAPHSWFVPPPPPPAVKPPPPPAPTAPPFPYAFIGSFTPEGHAPVFFLARGNDHVIDARVGDRLDGVYLFESAEGGQLVFVYLPLNTRQTLAAGAAP